MPRRGENIRKRNDGRWEGRYIKERDPEGKAIYGFVYGKTYAEVKQKKQLCISDLGKEETDLKTNLIFETIAQNWLRQISDQVRESTYAKYFRLCKLYICPFLGKAYLNGLTAGKMEEFTEYLLKSGGIRKDGLSAKSASDILTITKQILKYGKKKVDVKLPKQKKPVIHVLTQKEQATLEQQLTGSDDLIRLGILLVLYTGLRLGELCALKWADIDYESAFVQVRRSVSRIQVPDPTARRRTKLVMERPKTESSERSIPLPRFLLNYLEQYRRDDTAFLLTGTE